MWKKILLLIFLIGLAGGLYLWKVQEKKEIYQGVKLEAVLVLNKALIYRAGQTLPLRAGMSLEQNDVLETQEDSVVELIVAGSVRIWIKNKARLNLGMLEKSLHSKRERYRLSLVYGKGFFSLDKKPAGIMDFQVKTPTAVVGVRGTVFIINADSEKTQVKVARGKVGLERNVPLPAAARENQALVLVAQEKAEISEESNREFLSLYQTKRFELPKITKEPVSQDPELDWLNSQLQEEKGKRTVLLIIQENPKGAIFLGKQGLGSGNLEVYLAPGTYPLRIEQGDKVFEKEVVLEKDTVKIVPVFSSRTRNEPKPENKNLEPLDPKNNFKIQ